MGSTLSLVHHHPSMAVCPLVPGPITQLQHCYGAPSLPRCAVPCCVLLPFMIAHARLCVLHHRLRPCRPESSTVQAKRQIFMLGRLGDNPRVMHGKREWRGEADVLAK